MVSALSSLLLHPASPAVKRCHVGYSGVQTLKASVQTEVRLLLHLAGVTPVALANAAAVSLVNRASQVSPLHRCLRLGSGVTVLGASQLDSDTL